MTNEVPVAKTTKEDWARWGAICMFAVNTVCLGVFHLTNPTERDATEHNLPIQSTLDKLFFAVLILMAFELLDFLTKNSGKWLQSAEIPVRGKHLDDLRRMDILCIGFSKANTAPFTYFYLRYCWIHLPWDWHMLRWTNTLLPLPLLFILFDATYAVMHAVLHWQSLYPYIHKHHHIQKAPSRANVDAVNVHPIEFLLGEYNHWFVIFVWTRVAHFPLHASTALAFLVVGGILAGINHTRYDLVIALPVPGRLLLLFSRLARIAAAKNDRDQTVIGRESSFWTHVPIYDSKAHDVHHRIPQSNYGQYTMFWDYVFGSYRPYNPSDRINPESQLDPRTGKTIVQIKVE